MTPKEAEQILEKIENRIKAQALDVIKMREDLTREEKNLKRTCQHIRKRKRKVTTTHLASKRS